MDELKKRIAEALLNAHDSDGEGLAWSCHFWSREQAAEFLADAALRAVVLWDQEQAKPCDPTAPQQTPGFIPRTPTAPRS